MSGERATSASRSRDGWQKRATTSSSARATPNALARKRGGRRRGRRDERRCCPRRRPRRARGEGGRSDPDGDELADAIGDTPVLSVASELRFTKSGIHPTEDDRSIAERRRTCCAPVAAGLHSLAAASLARQGRTATPRLRRRSTAKDLALELASKVVSGRALDAGPLASARALEGMTAVIVNLNRRYKGHAGIRVVGL